MMMVEGRAGSREQFQRLRNHLHQCPGNQRARTKSKNYTLVDLEA